MKKIILVIKNAIQKLFNLLGYELHKFTKQKGLYTEEFSYGKIFEYFPFWQSKFLIKGLEYGGEADYDTERISCLNNQLIHDKIDFRGKTILELGPLEGGNSVLLSKMGAKEIISLEGRVDNYIKCCVVKNIYDLNNAKYYLDDCRNVSVDRYGKFDIALVAGVLYHLDNPHIMFKKLSNVADTLVVATHYADTNSPSTSAEHREIVTSEGSYRGKIYKEGTIEDPNSGLQSESFWPYEEDLIRMCKNAEYKNIEIVKKNPVESEVYRLIYFIARKG